jgi:hypothetical protein
VHLACVAGGIRGHERTGRLKKFDSLYMAKHTCGTHVRIKTRKIQNKLFLLALFKRNFLHESAWIQGWFYSHWANCEEFGRYSSFFRKYMIHLFRFVSVFWRHLTPRWKGYFVRITMVLFVLRGDVRWDLQLETIKIVKILNWGVFLKFFNLTRLLALTSKVVRR